MPRKTTPKTPRAMGPPWKGPQHEGYLALPPNTPNKLSRRAVLVYEAIEDAWEGLTQTDATDEWLAFATKTDVGSAMRAVLELAKVGMIELYTGSDGRIIARLQPRERRYP